MDLVCNVDNGLSKSLIPLTNCTSKCWARVAPVRRSPRISRSISSAICSERICVSSTSASIEWYALRSCANSGLQRALSLRVCAVTGIDSILMSISGILRLSLAALSGFASNGMPFSAETSPNPSPEVETMPRESAKRPDALNFAVVRTSAPAT